MGGCASKSTPPPAAAVDDEAEASKIAAARQRGKRSSFSSEDTKETDSAYVKKFFPKTPEQFDSIKEAVGNNFLFKALSESQRKEVVDSMDEKAVTVGTDVITQGDAGDYFYVVQTGEFDVFVTKAGEKPVFHYSPGGSFGELALMYNAPRAATVRACTDGLLWRVDRVTFRHIILQDTSTKRKQYETFLSKMPILMEAGLTPQQIAMVADVLEPMTFENGAKVIIQGDVSVDKFYLIEEGAAKAFIDGHNVGTMGAGDFFGEKALVESLPRAADVIADGTLKVAALDIAAFERLLGPVKGLFREKARNYMTLEQAKAKANSVAPL